LKTLLFPSQALTLEAELIIGALGYRFWHQWPEAVFTYTTGGRPWNSPCWLPFYWYTSLNSQEKMTFLRLLDQVGGRCFPLELTPLSIAAAYIAKRCVAIAAACRAERLPEKARCHFWKSWSVKGFTKELDLFPTGLQRAFKQLRPLGSRWERF
jgi:hypothetical protein